MSDHFGAEGFGDEWPDDDSAHLPEPDAFVDPVDGGSFVDPVDGGSFVDPVDGGSFVDPVDGDAFVGGLGGDHLDGDGVDTDNLGADRVDVEYGGERAGADTGPDLPHDGGDDAHGGYDGPDDQPGGEASIGADPDLPPEPDDGGWSAEVFPPPLDMHAPEPVDGHPWTDPTALGQDERHHPTLPDGVPAASDLVDYAAAEQPDGDPWTALAASEDPATSTLARFWGTPPG